MRKNILVLLNDLVSDYSAKVIDGIIDFYKNKDVNLILSNVKTAETISTPSELAYMTGLELAKAQNIDAIIVLSAIFSSTISKETLENYLRETVCKKIVSIALPLDLPGSVSTSTSSQDAYNEIVEHLHNEHGCSKFAFMSASATGSFEAIERFNSFKNAVEKIGLTFDEKLKFEGYFVYDGAHDALKAKYETKEEIDFDAILAANDMMAFGCIDYLNSIGVKVPDEVKVFGYDDIPAAATAELTLSTINQQIYSQGKIAAETALKMAHGKLTDENIIVETKPVYRNSCGCDSHQIEFSPEEKIQNEKKVRNMSVAQALESKMILQQTYFLLDAIQNEMTLPQLYKRFYSLLTREIIPCIAVCFYNEPVICIDKQSFYLPDKATVTLYIEKLEEVTKTDLAVTFNPHEKLFPEEFFGKNPGVFMTQPIYYSNKLYGYFICRITSKSILFDTIYEKVYTSVIAQSYIFTKQIEENQKLASENIQLQLDNTELVEMSTTDSLTELLNRRGFLDIGQDAINLAVKLNNPGIVCFADMDNLKFINDTYGHKMGDAAIATQAEILRTAFRKNDIIGRLGGDEFAAVLTGITLEDFDKIKKDLDELGKSIAQNKKLPFSISISTGVIQFSKSNKNLQKLLQQADKKQYIEKHKKHAERK